MARRRAILLGWAIACALVLLVVLKFFVADIYPVRSSSMVPTIFGGDASGSGESFDEWVLVAFEHAPKLERHDLVVWQPPSGDPIVKRVEGLPGERIQLADGDVLIEGRRVGDFGPSVDPIVVFDGSALDVGEYFQFKEGKWARNDEGGWDVDASEVRVDSDAGMMFFRRRLRDDHLDPFGARISGIADVNDVIIECDVLVDEPIQPRSRIRLQLVEDGDTFQLHIQSNGVGGFVVRVLRRNPLETREVLFNGPIDFVVGAWQHLAFANVDNVLSLHLNDEPVLRINYERNVPLGSHAGRQTIGPRVGFGAEQANAHFRSILVMRDLFYTDTGDYAVTSLLSLGLDEYFLLGDNSSRSKDSRHFGPVRATDLVGRPIAVVWPLSRIRKLH